MDYVSQHPPLSTPPAWLAECYRECLRWSWWRRGTTGAPAQAGLRMSMAKGDSWSVRSVSDIELRCESGTLWITYPEYAGDVVLSAGEHVLISTSGKILIGAVCDSVVDVPEDITLKVSRTSAARRAADGEQR